MCKSVADGNNNLYRYLKQKGFTDMIIWCLKDNLPSVEFYKAMGGTVTDERDFEIDGNLYKEDLARKNQGKGKPSMLSQYSRDLTEMARTGKLDPVIGRDEEVRRIIQVLNRRTKNNPVLIG